MSEPKAIEEKTRARYWWLLLFIFVAAGVTVTVISMKKSSNPAHINFVADPNGNVRLLGVPLLNTNIRDKAFSAMSAMGFKGNLVVPPNAATNVQARDKVIQTLDSMRRAGLFPTNSPAHPILSPFE
jgi:hypothetical protein